MAQPQKDPLRALSEQEEHELQRLVKATGRGSSSQSEAFSGSRKAIPPCSRTNTSGEAPPNS